VAISTLKKRGNFWRADWFVGVLVVLAVLILHQAGDLIGTLERQHLYKPPAFRQNRRDCY
jgi:eukaryotic-like serine/threonine-protein kinase